MSPPPPPPPPPQPLFFRGSAKTPRSTRGMVFPSQEVTAFLVVVNVSKVLSHILLQTVIGSLHSAVGQLESQRLDLGDVVAVVAHQPGEGHLADLVKLLWSIKKEKRRKHLV